MEFGGAFNESIILDASAQGTLRLDQSVEFSGSVSGFDSNDVLDLGDIVAASASFNFTANAQNTGGILSVTDGTHTANINLTGQYDAANFQVSTDSGSGTLVSYVLTGAMPSEQPQ